MTDAGAWSTYWAEAPDSACLPGAPAPVHVALNQVWSGFAGGLPTQATVLDIAAGNGAVIRAITAARCDVVAHGIDAANVGAVGQGLGIAGGIDAAALPFADATFDAVVSQFGIEYCGAAALAESVRVLRPGGQLCFIVHHEASPAVAHNRARLGALRALADAGLFALARRAAAGLPEDATAAARVAAMRRAHGDQAIADELPVALGRALRGAGALAAVGAIERAAGAEMARLTAMVAAARNSGGMVALTNALTGVETTTDVLATAAGETVAWHVTTRR